MSNDRAKDRSVKTIKKKKKKKKKFVREAKAEIWDWDGLALEIYVHR
jgi:hypothetical protein